MIDLSNLYKNMTAVCESASLHELETMLRVIGNALPVSQLEASRRVFAAADVLKLYRSGKLLPQRRG